MATIFGRSWRGDHLTGTAEGDDIFGWSEGDDSWSDSWRDTLEGGDGDDHLNGGGGDDTLRGGRHNDTLVGGLGGDVLDGGQGIDTATYWFSLGRVLINLDLGTGFGGEAEGDTFISVENVIGSGYDDVITAHRDGSTLDAWDGDDRLYGLEGADTLLGGDGIDRLWGEAGEDTLDGGEGDDFLYGGLDGDTFVASQGADLNSGGAGLGRDLVDYSTSPSGVVVNLTTGIGSGGFAEGDRYASIEDVTGSRFGDRITGDGGNNVLLGGGGVDDIRGGEGNDLLIGGAGADQLDGGGNTAGGDLISYESSSTGVWVDMAAGSGRFGDAEGDKFARIEHVTGSSHKDTLLGDGGNNTLEGKAGSDELHGNLGADILLGGTQDDRLWGDGGADHLWGGTGSDTFVYASVSDSPYSPPEALGRFDTIHDFAAGSDKIDLSAVDADATHAGHQAFNLVFPTHVHSGAIGDLSAIYVAEGAWNLVGETDGDAAADFFIRVNQDTAGFLFAGDFILL